MEMDHRDSDIEDAIPQEGCRDLYYIDKKSALYNQSGAELSENDDDVREVQHTPVENTNGTPEPAILNNNVNVKQEREDVKVPTTSVAPTFTLPVPFPFPHPFLPPAPANFSTQAPHNNSSGSSHSSESSSGSQQTWSFEEQFKQVRQLYEISDDPKRKEFLDDLFGFMQRRGTPINRLPIMAKSVLDLYELYNLVIQRGGLVDVINKKLWQEIIKGLHLPSSITSAAFTLRTQYMKYLYPYECEKRRLSTPGELQAAIDGNRREGRRGSYGTYADMLQRSPPTQNSPLSLVTGRPGSVNGLSNHHHLHANNNNNNNNHLPPHHALLPAALSGLGALQFSEIENRMAEYVKLINKEPTTPPPAVKSSPPSSPPEVNPSMNLTNYEMSRLALWNMYHAHTNSDFQKEALNLEKREEANHQTQPPKRHCPDNDEVHHSGAHIKISSRGDGRGGVESSLVVSMEINGTMYQGVLFPQTRNNRH